MTDRCPTDVKYEFHGMDMDIYKNFSPSKEYKMTVILHTKTDHHYIIDDVVELEVRSGSLEGSPLEDNDGFRFQEAEEVKDV